MPGKLQLGPAWWYNDHRLGISRQLEAVAALGLLGRMLGMVSDSRSLLSSVRHEYFRRLLCNLIGKWVEEGCLPGDLYQLGELIANICYKNAARWLQIPQIESSV
jgi:glucuronate isomerase